MSPKRRTVIWNNEIIILFSEITTHGSIDFRQSDWQTDGIFSEYTVNFYNKLVLVAYNVKYHQ